MTKEVLLMSDVQDLGAEGDVVSVADGYARNYLLPRKLAAPVTEATRRRLVKIQERRADERQAELAAAQKMADRLSGVSCTIPMKVVEEEKLFGSVTVVEIAKALADQDIIVDKSSLVLEAPIKELGVFDLAVNLHPDVKATVKVWVVEE